MHPGFHAWWKARAHGGCGEGSHAGCGPSFHGHGHRHGHEHGAEGPFAWSGPGFEADASSAFGVRRPLRFLAHKLELDEPQVTVFATILDELKTERAQAAVDQRRRISALADAIEGTTFDDGKAQSAGDEQLKSSERVRAAVEKALKRMHAALNDEQRKRLAYLLRTGVLSV